MTAVTELFVELCSGVWGFPVTENKYAERRGWWVPEGPTPPLGAARPGPTPRAGEAASWRFSVSPSDSVFVT